MKAAFISAIALGAHLARAEDEISLALERKFAICEFDQPVDISKDEPNIHGKLLFKDGHDRELN